MAFWGAEVKPGKPYTHHYDDNQGRLRISQATLGYGSSTKRSFVQCTIGSKSPVLLCSLLPDKAESCSLDLEFEESEDVVLSVIGPHSVHLTGYYPGSRSSGNGDETDSYGEDTAETESDSCDSEDEYEADFIDDSDIEMLPPSPRPNSGVIIEEIVDDVKPTNGNASRHRLKKKHQKNDHEVDDGSQHQIIAKHNHTLALESEDEDGFPIKFTVRHKPGTKGAGGDDNMDHDDLKSVEGQIKSTNNDLTGTYEVDGGEKDQQLKKKKKKKAGVKYSEIIGGGAGLSTERNDVETRGGQLHMINDNIEPITENIDQGQSAKDGQEKMPNGKETVAPSLPSGALNMQKLNKKNRKRKSEEEFSQVGTHKSPETLKKDGSGQSQIMEDNVVIDETRYPKPEEKALKENMDQDRSITMLPNGESPNIDDDPPAKKKSRKKKKKSKTLENDKEKTHLVGAEGKTKPGKDTEVDEPRAQKTRTFPNGLAIDELSMGKPDGKRASPGNKVYVHYIGKLQNGKIFDSNIGQRPFKFRLGVGQVIKGWDVGINGMRIGDKRRLTVPPSMGYGSKGAGKIPGNSWLVFDVELVDVQ